MSILIRQGDHAKAIPFQPEEIEAASRIGFMPSSAEDESRAAALELLVYYVRAEKRDALETLRARFLSLSLWIVRDASSEIGFELAKAQLQLAGSHLVITIDEQGGEPFASFELFTIPCSSTMH
jgi:hypothetical protein